jgi:hypothetical protein
MPDGRSASSDDDGIVVAMMAKALFIEMLT